MDHPNEEIVLTVKTLAHGGHVLTVNGEIIAAGISGVVASGAARFLRATLKKEKSD